MYMYSRVVNLLTEDLDLWHKSDFLTLGLHALVNKWKYLSQIVLTGIMHYGEYLGHLKEMFDKGQK